jgi:hypothetical protein
MTQNASQMHDHCYIVALRLYFCALHDALSADAQLKRTLLVQLQRATNLHLHYAVVSWLSSGSVAWS